VSRQKDRSLYGLQLALDKPELTIWLENHHVPSPASIPSHTQLMVSGASAMFDSVFRHIFTFGNAFMHCDHRMTTMIPPHSTDLSFYTLQSSFQTHYIGEVRLSPMRHCSLTTSIFGMPNRVRVVASSRSRREGKEQIQYLELEHIGVVAKFTYPELIQRQSLNIGRVSARTTASFSGCTSATELTLGIVRICYTIRRRSYTASIPSENRIADYSSH
jgi:hypothetical protein